MVEKRFEESRSRSPKDCVHRGLGQRLNKQKNHSFRGSGMDGFSHLYYRCIACQYYTKLVTSVASNAYGAPYVKTLISAKVEMRVFCLLRLCPNPRRTQFCVLETLEKSSSYAILQIAKWASTPVLFRFSRHGERKVSCRCQQDCHKHQPRLPPHQQHRAFLRCRRCRTESAAGRDLGAVEGTAKGRALTTTGFSMCGFSVTGFPDGG